MTNRKPSIQKFAKAFCLGFFALIVIGNSTFAQEVVVSRQERLAASLVSGNDERKLEAVIDMGTLLSFSTRATPQTISLLGNLLQSDSSALIRALAVRAMELSRDERFVPSLLSSLKTEREPAVRKAIIHALAYHRLSEVVETLLPMLKDKNQDVRAAAAFALAEIGDPVSTDALIDLLSKSRSEEDAFTRTQAIRGLGKIGNRAAIDSLLNTLNRDKSSEVRRESVRSLGQIANAQDVKVIEALKLIKLQSDPYLAALAASALEKLKL